MLKVQAAIGQDTWLTAPVAAEYAMTRRWSSAIPDWAPWAGGLMWRSHREPDGFAYVLFADRCPNDCFREVTDGLPVPHENRNLGGGVARRYVEGILTSYLVALF